MTVTIRIHKPDTSTQWLNAPLHASFNGPKATVTDAYLEFDGSNLRASGPDTGRRFVPNDPVWWLPFLEVDAPEYIDVKGESQASA